MLETIILAIIISAAIGYVGYRLFFKQRGGCCSGGCSSSSPSAKNNCCNQNKNCK